MVFNLGAVTSQQALACDRSTEPGLRESASLFQEAAGYFAALREGLCLRLERPPPADLSPEACDMLCHLMLAQAQECIFEKAAGDGKSAALLARLARQTAIFYDECSQLLSSSPLSSHFDRSWAAHAAVKSALHGAEALAQAGSASGAADALGGVAQEIARLRVAKVKLAEAKREAKNASKELQESVAYKESAIDTRLAKADRENATIYLQRIPDGGDLPAIVPVALAKPTTPGDLSAAGDKASTMFSSVIPDTATRSLSRYSDLLDSLVRGATDKLAAASDEARLRLREWELPEALQALEPGALASIPDGLRSDLDEIERAGGARHLHEVADEVRALRAVAAEELAGVEGSVRAEEADDERLRSHYGVRWDRAPSSHLTRSIRDRVAGYRSNMAVAAESDARLERRLAAEETAFAALGLQAAAAEMPRLQAPMLSVDDMGPAATLSTLRNALEELSTLSSRRASLEEALKVVVPCFVIAIIG